MKNSLFFCLMLFPSLVLSEQIIEVVDDHNNGVFSSIYLESQENHFGDTDKNGKLVSEKNCLKSKSVIALPKSPFYEKGKIVCSDNNKLSLKVTWKPFYVNLKKNKDYFLNKGDFATVALISNELSARTVDKNSTINFQTKTVKYFAKYLNVNTKFQVMKYDVQQQKKVLTPEMKRAIILFQNKNGLSETGKVDYNTLSIAAKRDIGSVMFRELK